MNPSFWSGRRVLLTGHTGFKGAWSAMMLRALGAEVYGCSLPPDDMSLFVAGGVAGDVHHAIGDIRDYAALKRVVDEAKPSVVIHMAAQSLVRRSYQEPVETYATNVMGTVHLLEAIRGLGGVDAVVVVTSDKVYENTGHGERHLEGDRLGGYDPYSSSKACAELLTAAYRRSFFGREGSAAVASVRAGNVIGGGDWAQDRLVPDAIRAFSTGESLRIRSPRAVRPWQHVLDAITGYLALAERLASKSADYSGAWNFGPTQDSEVPVETVVSKLVALWGGSAQWAIEPGDHPHESACLRLDSSKSLEKLGWRPSFDLDESLRLTFEWYRSFYERNDVRAVAQMQITKAIDVCCN